MLTPFIIYRETLDSTSLELHRLLGHDPDLPHGTVVSTRVQTAGRGQRGNTWESAPEANVTFSILLRPEAVAANEQFALSEAISLAVAEFLDPLVGHRGTVSVKWPNDVYVDDRKICGMLIENTLSGTDILWSMAGVGININQRKFTSDAPNPVSLYQLTGVDHALTVAEEEVCRAILERVARLDTEQGRRDTHAEYRRRLWRGRGMHPYVTTSNGDVINGEIADVAVTGHLQLRLADGSQRSFAFKEIHPVF